MGSGRKPIDNHEILSGILSDSELLATFKGGIEEVEKALIVLGGAQEKVKSIIDAVAEKTKLAKGFIKKLAVAHLAGGAGDILAEAEALVEMLETAFGDEEAPF